MDVTRRVFFALMCGFAATFLGRKKLSCSAENHSPVDSGAENGREAATAIGRRFAGETFDYTMSFLWFQNAASCRVSLEETAEPSIYEAAITGQTHGIIGAFTRFRRDILRARMEEVDGGTRFRPLEFHEDVIVGSKQRKKTTLFDYLHHQITITRERKGRITEKTLPLPPGETYYDPLTASYNFRFGSFGPVRRGGRYSIKTVPEKKLRHINVSVASAEEERSEERSEYLTGIQAYFVYLQLDKELVHSTSGTIEGWLSESMIPMEGRVRDVILFGDVTGRKIS